MSGESCYGQHHILQALGTDERCGLTQELSGKWVGFLRQVGSVSRKYRRGQGAWGLRPLMGPTRGVHS